MNYKEAVEYIEQTLKFGSKLGLERMRRITKRLGNPEKELKVIHVAGTNGKGSTCSMIAHTLKIMGFKTGLFISPHLIDFKERIQINEEYISEEDIIKHTEIVKKVIEEEMASGMEQPTEFEIVTAMMFNYFKEQRVDYAVIEVGLGGTLDSTNVVNPILSVITHISYDHQKVLGNSLSEIASNKAGIIKGAPVIVYPQEADAENVILKKAADMNSKVYKVDKESAQIINFDEKRAMQRVELKFKGKSIETGLNLLGTHQLLNAATALKTLEVLSGIENLEIDEDIIRKSLESVTWMGRFEKMSDKPLIYIDGAHNIDGITKLKESMDFYLRGKSYHLILGILSDKEVDKMIDVIVPDAKQIYCVTPNSDRAELSTHLNDLVALRNKNTRYYLSYENALSDAIANCYDGEYIMVAGSLYMIGDMRKIIMESKK